ncbi:MAG: cupin domain-containing protein [Burkholderiales bacterium]|nr:cupin domain-containing protein [Burkholderiales bacterium]
MSTVRELARLVESADTRVVEFELSAGSAGPWHHHSRMVEHCYCLGTELTVEFERAADIRLKAGQRCEIASGTVHRIRNGSPVACKYLVVQRGGEYDFVEHTGAT